MMFLIYLGPSVLGLLGLVLSMIGVGWFVTHPKEPGESLLRGKRGWMFSLCVVAIPIAAAWVVAFSLLIFRT